jgi:hypothetical protein
MAELLSERRYESWNSKVPELRFHAVLGNGDREVSFKRAIPG